MSATNSYDISTMDCIREGMIAFFLTEKIVIEKKLLNGENVEFDHIKTIVNLEKL